jgi:hypothetical protein
MATQLLAEALTKSNSRGNLLTVKGKVNNFAVRN